MLIDFVLDASAISARDAVCRAFQSVVHDALKPLGAKCGLPATGVPSEPRERWMARVAPASGNAVCAASNRWPRDLSLRLWA